MEDMTIEPTKVAVIGAGSAQFGLNTVAALLRSDRLRGSHLALVDRDPAALERMARLAERLDAEWGAGMTITSHTHHETALPGTAFVVSAIEVAPREALWRSDFDIGLRHGVRQPYAENGGPGGFAHALRNIGPVLEIARSMEVHCPDAWFVNFSNPMIRICDAIHRHSRIRVVGLCHQVDVGYRMVGAVLAADLGIDLAGPPIHHQARARLDIVAAGVNHCTWALEIRDRATGEDLYPLFRERWASHAPSYEPLTRDVFAAFGRFPMTGDSHLSEYLPWVSDPVTRPWERYGIPLYDWDGMAQLRGVGHDAIDAMGRGTAPIDALRETDSEGALEMVEHLAGAGRHEHQAVNVPNDGLIANLPDGAIVEVPGTVTDAGVAGRVVGPLPEGIAELCRRELTVVRMVVDAAVHGDRDLALQALLLDPVVRDLEVARALLDDYLETYRAYLPQFWD